MKLVRSAVRLRALARVMSRRAVSSKKSAQSPSFESKGIESCPTPYTYTIGVGRPDNSGPPKDLPFGYNVGMGETPLAMPPNMQARGFRQEVLLNTHDGEENRDSDYKQDVQGYWYRQRFDGV